MKIVVHIAVMELIRVLRDKGAFFWLLAFPIIYAGFFGMIRYTGSSSAVIGLCISNADTGFVSRGLSDRLDRFALELHDTTGLAEYDRTDQFVLQAVEPSDTIPDGCVRMLVIPEGFTDSLLHGSGTTLDLSVGSTGDPVATMTARVFIWRSILETMSALFLAQEDSTGRNIHGAFQRRLSTPDKVTVRSHYIGGVRQPPSGFQQTVPGTIVMMALMILVTHGSAALVSERKQGLLLHLASTPASRGNIIWGKLLGRYFIAATQCILLWFIMLLTHHLLRIWLGYRLFEVLALLLIYAFSAAGIAFFIAALVKSIDTGIGIGITVTLFMSALGGCWWPLEIVPRSMRIAGHLFPTAWAMDALHQLMAYNHGLPSVGSHIAILMGYGVIFAFLASRVLKLN
jgi:ABC-2 type transport system permease protein